MASTAPAPAGSAGHRAPHRKVTMAHATPAPLHDPSGTGPGPTSDLWQETGRALSFGRAADQYDTARPGYPPVLFETVERELGRPLRGADTVDVGAGTGIATRLLVDRGARVVAVEPGDGMAARFRRTLPGTPVVRAIGDRLPLADHSADLITYAQSWHWTDPRRALPEALRVLRPGGALALWWNTADRTVPWIAAQSERLVERLGNDTLGAPGNARRLPDGAPASVLHSLRWTRDIPLDTHLANIGSHSAFLTADPQAADDALRRERTELLRLFPDGRITEEYTVLLTVMPAPRNTAR
ncbi:class I SAM-dependent methyltransferase [Streptomyces sp. NPDC000594]|uniref:class I SAM-dependent methyltransferase n=1 Tax=Streptomyces sp. NPDC000594 TaxID=3154261 RepID=UPI0033223B96